MSVSTCDLDSPVRTDRDIPITSILASKGRTDVRTVMERLIPQTAITISATLSREGANFALRSSDAKTSSTVCSVSIVRTALDVSA